MMKLTVHTASQLDIEAMAAETFGLVIAFNNPDGTPYSLASHSATLRIQPVDGPVVQWQSPADITIAANTITVSKLLNVPAGTHQYQLLLTFPDAQIKTTHQGRFIVLPSIA